MFSIFYDVNMSAKSKIDSEFSHISVKFPKIWQTGRKYFEACFFSEIYWTSFFTALKEINLPKLEKN